MVGKFSLTETFSITFQSLEKGESKIIEAIFVYLCAAHKIADVAPILYLKQFTFFPKDGII